MQRSLNLLMGSQGQALPPNFNLLRVFSGLRKLRKSLNFNAYTLCEVNKQSNGVISSLFPIQKPVAQSGIRSMIPVRGFYSSTGAYVTPVLSAMGGTEKSIPKTFATLSAQGLQAISRLQKPVSRKMFVSGGAK